ncbi:MAG TPA: hypothetical protein VHE61_04155, partial [Opitutaceae bacterium]|nr:hypothetical protein [Opitutaceae bacterium]
ACTWLNHARLPVPLIDAWTNRMEALEQPLVAALVFVLMGFLVAFVRESMRLAGDTREAGTNAATGTS